MRRRWTPDTIRFMLDAAERSDYYQTIAKRASAYFPPGAHVCDAGCGLGILSLALLPYCRRVTAIDVNPAPLDVLRARLADRRRERLEIVCGNMLTLRRGERYDAMVFCLFGSMEEILEIASVQCAGPVIAVKRDYLGHRVLSGGPSAGHDVAERAEGLLRRLGIPCRTERFTLEMGQPFHSLKDAECFFRAYDQEHPPDFDAFCRRLVPGPAPEYPYYLPVRKPLCLLAFQAEDVRERWEAQAGGN